MDQKENSKAVEEVIEACQIIIESGQLDEKERKFLEKCQRAEQPDLYLQKNLENLVCQSIFKKLAQIHEHIEKKS